MSSVPLPTATPESATPAAATLSKSGQRSLLVDIVKGLAIMLVTMGHTNQGMLHRLWWHSSFGERLDNFIYAFHMPAFFFVSGIFLYSSLTKRGPKRFVAGKLETILYPFWVWASIFPFVPYIFSRFVSTPALPLKVELLNLLTGNLEWFLPTLFVTMMLGALLHRVPVLLSFLLSIVISHYWPFLNIACIDRAFMYLPFLLAGIWVGKRIEGVQKLSVFSSFVGILLAASGIYFSTAHRVVASNWFFVPVGLLGTAMLFFIGRLMGTTWLARIFAWAGVASIGIFLLSAFGQGLGRELLVQAHIFHPALQLIIPTITATFLPAWIYQRRERLHIGWLFVSPFRIER